MYVCWYLDGPDTLELSSGLQEDMKTRIQDLDEQSFKEFIADKLIKQESPKDKNPTDISRQNFEDKGKISPGKQLKDKSDNPPTLVREDPITPVGDHRSSIYHKLTSREKITKTCGCTYCESVPRKKGVIRRHEITQAGTVTLFSQNGIHGVKSDDLHNDLISIDGRSFKCDICSKKFDTYDRLIRHRNSHKAHSGKLPYECEECGQRFWSVHYLAAHCRMQHAERDKINTCKICGAGFRWESNLNEHIKTHTEDEDIKCDACGEQFSQKIFLTEHMKTHIEPRLHQCHECEARFLTESNLRAHIKTHHSENSYKCVICGERFFFENTLEEHVLTHIGIYPYKCDECGAGFNHENHLKEHSSVHGRTKFRTNYNSRSFSSDIVISKHVTSHRKAEKCTCHICRAVLVDHNALVSHLQIHKKSEYTCETCGKYFLSKCTLARHEKQHIYENLGKTRSSDKSTEESSEIDDESLFDCSLCYVQFDTLEELKTHFLTHGGKDKISTPKRKNMSYNCAICHKRFRKSKTLRMHILTHSPLTNHTCCCQICGAGFTLLEHLEEHIQNHHSSKHQCDICDKIFDNEKELDTHIETHFEKDSPLALDVTEDVNERTHETPLTKTDEPRCGIVTSDAEIDCKNSHVDKNPLTEIKQEPIEMQYIDKLKGIAKQVICSSKTKTLSTISESKHVDTTYENGQEINTLNEVGSTKSPQRSICSPQRTNNIPFSPRGRFIGSDTDSGYSDKPNLITSDSESVYSPQYVDSESSYTNKGNPSKYIFYSNTRSSGKDNDPNLPYMDSSTKTVVSHNSTGRISAVKERETPRSEHDNIPSKQEEDKTSCIINTHSSVSCSSKSLTLTQNSNEEVPSHNRKRCHEPCTNDDDELRPKGKQRVPFLFTFPGKKVQLQQNSHVNFHLLGKLK